MFKSNYRIKPEYLIESVCVDTYSSYSRALTSGFIQRHRVANTTSVTGHLQLSKVDVRDRLNTNNNSLEFGNRLIDNHRIQFKPAASDLSGATSYS